MDKSVVIIPNETITSLPFLKVNCKEHRVPLKKYIINHDISIPLESIEDAHSISYELMEQGVCVILYDHKEELKNIIMFIPKNISLNQYEYLTNKEQVKDYKDYNIYILSSEENKKVFYDKSSYLNQILSTKRLLIKK